MIDLRLPDLGMRRVFGMYVASIIRTRSSLPTFVTSMLPYQPTRSLLPGGTFFVLGEILTVFPASFDDWSHQNGNLMVSTTVVIVLAFLELGKVLSRHTL